MRLASLSSRSGGRVFSTVWSYARCEDGFTFAAFAAFRFASALICFSFIRLLTSMEKPSRNSPSRLSSRAQLIERPKFSRSDRLRLQPGRRAIQPSPVQYDSRDEA